MQDETKLQQREATYRSLLPLMDEQMRRQGAATETRAYGWVGVGAVSGVLGIAPNSTRLAMELRQQGHAVSLRTVGRLHNADGYSLQSKRKTIEGKEHPGGNLHFKHIDAGVAASTVSR